MLLKGVGNWLQKEVQDLLAVEKIQILFWNELASS